MANVEHEQAPDQLAANGPGRPGQGGDAPSSQGSAPAYDEAQMDPAEYARLLDIYDNSFRNIAEGEVVKGTVLKVTESEVIVDVGFKSEGIIPIDEFLDENRQVTVQPGDVVDVLLEKTEDREGYVVLSREKAEKMKIWDEVEKAYAERKVVIGRVIERIKGGLAVDIGVRAFLPGSQIDVRPVRNLDALRGQELRMRVIKVNKKRGNIVLSRKVLLEEENAEKKKHTLETLAEGKVLRGVVKNITDYGAFIDLGGIDGLLHITDMSWGRVGHPSEIFKVNDEVDVVVLEVRPGDRARLARPQAARARIRGRRCTERYPVGARVSGKVVSLTDYGAFIELEAGRRGPDPRQRDVVEQARQAPVEDPERRRHRRGDGARRGSDGAAHLARPEAGRAATRGTTWPRSIRSARASRARCATSPSSARSSRSRRTSTA